MYGRNHPRGRRAEQSWTPPAEYLAEQAAYLAALDAEWEQREAATAQAVRITRDEAQALTWWTSQPDAAILTDGTAYAVGQYPQVAAGRDGWRQTCPEELGSR